MFEVLLFWDWLKENLPDLLKVWINLKSDINWKIDNPFNFNKARLANVKGNVKGDVTGNVTGNVIVTANGKSEGSLRVAYAGSAEMQTQQLILRL